jgi:hypothetical protein
MEVPRLRRVQPCVWSKCTVAELRNRGTHAKGMAWVGLDLSARGSKMASSDGLGQRRGRPPAMPVPSAAEGSEAEWHEATDRDF